VLNRSSVDRTPHKRRPPPPHSIPQSLAILDQQEHQCSIPESFLTTLTVRRSNLSQATSAQSAVPVVENLHRRSAVAPCQAQALGDSHCSITLQLRRELRLVIELGHSRVIEASSINMLNHHPLHELDVSPTEPPERLKRVPVEEIIGEVESVPRIVERRHEAPRLTADVDETR